VRWPCQLEPITNDRRVTDGEKCSGYACSDRGLGLGWMQGKEGRGAYGRVVHRAQYLAPIAARQLPFKPWRAGRNAQLHQRHPRHSDFDLEQTFRSDFYRTGQDRGQQQIGR